MAKSRGARSIRVGVYSTLYYRSPLGVPCKEWLAWQERVLREKSGSGWRYPVVPKAHVLPSLQEAKKYFPFDWQAWFAEMKPWLESRLNDANEKGLRAAFGCVSDALDLWEAIDALRSQGNGDVDEACRLSLELGRRIEMLHALQFDSQVAARLASDRALTERNKKRPTAIQLRQQALDAIEATKLRHRDRCDDNDFIKTKAAQSLNITKRALNARLSK